MPRQSSPIQPVPPAALVECLRQATPYIHAHRGRTFVIAIGGEALTDSDFPKLVHDLALLHSLGIRLVLVHGARPQIEARLRERDAELHYVNGLRITDSAALACVKEAAGSVRVEIEGLLSLGLANSPMAGVRVPVVSGNFVIARPLGVLNGIDYQHTGAVRRLDREALHNVLQQGAIALMPPLGYSPTGEVFNLSAADVARASAIALGADKLVFMVEPGHLGNTPALGSNLLAGDIEQLLADTPDLPEELAAVLRAAAEACSNGVPRIHLIERQPTGTLLLELFTPDGSGTLISGAPYEALREARIEDVTAILELLQPLEERGVLVRRSRERLETEIEHFLLTERDGFVTSCVAFYPYPEERMAELACLAVHPHYRRGQRGERLLDALECRARRQGLSQLFVLTTQTAHWFQERGFQPASTAILPPSRQALYSTRRGSKVLVKSL